MWQHVGLLSTGPVFTQDFIDGLKGVMPAFVNAEISISEPETARWDAGTKSYQVEPGATLYAGPARVLPRRAALNQPLRENPTVTQATQFQIPIDGYTFDLRTSHRVSVTACELNPTLTKYQYKIHEIVDSGNPIEYTFWCIVDEEVSRGD